MEVGDEGPRLGEQADLADLLVRQGPVRFEHSIGNRGAGRGFYRKGSGRGWHCEPLRGPP